MARKVQSAMPHPFTTSVQVEFFVRQLNLYAILPPFKMKLL